MSCRVGRCAVLVVDHAREGPQGLARTGRCGTSTKGGARMGGTVEELALPELPDEEAGRAPKSTDSRRAAMRDMVLAAMAGDSYAWSWIVRNLNGLVWSVARAEGLQASDAADVCQATWLSLVQHLRELRDPEQLPAWLATVARRESWRCRRGRDTLPIPEASLIEDQRGNHGTCGSPRLRPLDDTGLMAGLDGRALTALSEVFEDSARASSLSRMRHALAQLPSRQRSLLSLLSVQPPMTYAEIASVLDMPIGSIGPTRRRALASLRRMLGAGYRSTSSA